jgi:hypothetical protein
VPLQRSTRARRLAVAFLVVLVLAVAARFARASSHDASTAPFAPAPSLLFSPDIKFVLLPGPA